jgi:hypothetical protein
MAINLDTSSRFANSQPIVENGVATFGRWARPTWMNADNLDESSMIKVVIDQSNSGRPDTIANQYYGDPRLEWIVVLFNRPLEPIGWPQVGMVIKIPIRTVIFTS